MDGKTPQAIDAQQQKARSFELRAALSLAKLSHSTERPADAHAVLTSAHAVRGSETRDRTGTAIYVAGKQTTPIQFLLRGS